MQCSGQRLMHFQCNRGSEPCPYWEGPSPPPTRNDARSAAVADAVDGTGVMVGDEQRAIRHLVHVRGPAPRLVVLQPPRGEAFLLRWLAHGERDRRHAVSKLLGAVPG